MQKKPPFEGWTKDHRTSRLFSIAFGFGVICGVTFSMIFTGTLSRAIFVAVFVMIIVARYYAQVYWPDVKAEGDPLYMRESDIDGS